MLNACHPLAARICGGHVDVPPPTGVAFDDRRGTSVSDGTTAALNDAASGGGSGASAAALALAGAGLGARAASRTRSCTRGGLRGGGGDIASETDDMGGMWWARAARTIYRAAQSVRNGCGAGAAQRAQDGAAARLDERGDLDRGLAATLLNPSRR